MALLCCTVTASCSSDERQPAPPWDDADGGDTDPSETKPEPRWQIERVDDTAAGVFVRLVILDDARPAVAYWANAPYPDGPCTEVAVGEPTRLRNDLYYAERRPSADGWQVETIAAPPHLGAPTGLSLAVSETGTVGVAFTGGEAHEMFCGAHDAIYGQRDGDRWAFETASADSGEAATGEAASDYGHVVGYWPALAFDNQGRPAVVHKDVHAGSLQHDDRYRADLELAWREGSWSHEALDYGEGAGDFSALVFDAGGTAMVFYAITIDAQTASRLGVWGLRQQSDGSWARVQLHVGQVHREVEALVHPETAEVVVGFYSHQDKAVRLRRLDDTALFSDAGAWSAQVVGDARFDEGRALSLAWLRDGELAMSYHRCRRLTSTSASCDVNDEALIFAAQNGATWSYEVVTDASEGGCGDYTSLAVDDQGTAWIAHRCAVGSGSALQHSTFVAHAPYEDQP